MIESAFPIVVTADLSRALGFWQDLLGGTVTYQFPSDGEPGYVGLDLGTSHLGIGVDPSLDASSQAGRISIWCSRFAMRESTAIGSPCEPVDM